MAVTAANPLAGRGVRAGAAAALIAVIVGLWIAAARHGDWVSLLHELPRNWPLLAPAIFIALHCAAAAAFLPCSPFTFAAGFLWGPGLGLAISVIAALAASCCTFLIARFLSGAEWRDRTAASAAGRMLAGLANFGWKGVAIAQLNPVLPASALGYVFGLSPLKLRTYAGAAFIAMLPLQTLFVMAGASARGALFEESAVLAPISIAGFAGVLYLVARRITKRAQRP